MKKRNLTLMLVVAISTTSLISATWAGFGPTLATSGSAADILVGGGTTHPIVIVWDDNQNPDVNLLASSIDLTDITVTGPGGALSVLSVLRDPDANVPTITATYTVEAPGGSWDIGDNGIYVVDINDVEVRIEPDPAFNNPQPGITSFNVNIVPEPTSLALLGFASVAFLFRRR